MAEMFIVAVRDRGVDAFGVPFFVRHKNEAVRSFKDEVNRNGSIFNNHPDDYDLYLLGSFDDNGGKLSPVDVQMIAVGKSLINE